MTPSSRIYDARTLSTANSNAATLVRSRNCFRRSAAYVLEQVRLAGRTAGIRIEPVAIVRGPEEAEAAFATISQEGADAVVVQGIFFSKTITELARPGPNCTTCAALARNGERSTGAVPSSEDGKRSTVRFQPRITRRCTGRSAARNRPIWIRNTPTIPQDRAKSAKPDKPLLRGSNKVHHDGVPAMAARSRESCPMRREDSTLV
jgi:hypothetical protein